MGLPEIVIIGLIIVLLLGVGKLSRLGRDLGQSVKEFRTALKDEQVHQAHATSDAPQAQPPRSSPPAPNASSPSHPPSTPSTPPDQRTPFIF